MKRAYSLTFDDQATAQVAELTDKAQLSKALGCFDLTLPNATLVVIGGASGLTDDYLQRLKGLFSEIICPFVERHHLVVVDGGTDSGVMRLMGQARRSTESTFPLLGVVVRRKTYLPGEKAQDDDAAPLEPNHTHFMLVPGEEWGDESGWIARVADAVSHQGPSATLLSNGGKIALSRDVPNSLKSNRPVLVISGSGRAADELATALAGGPTNEHLDPMLDTGLIQAIALEEGSDRIQSTLTRFFNTVSKRL